MPRRIHQVQRIGVAILRRIIEPHGLRFNGDAALFLNIHRIENLIRHFAIGQRPGLLDQPIRQSRLAMVDVCDDRKITYAVYRCHSRDIAMPAALGKDQYTAAPSGPHTRLVEPGDASYSPHMSDSEPALTSSQDAASAERAPSMPMDCWYFAGLTADYKAGAQLRRMILGDPVVIGRTNAGEIFAMRDICPHRLVPLSAGRQLDTNGEPTLECPYHGWRFGTDGVCRLLPSLTEDDPTDPSRIKVRQYPVREANGIVYVFVSSDVRFQGAPETPLPEFSGSGLKPKRVGAVLIEAPQASVCSWFDEPSRGSVIPTHWAWHPLQRAGGLGAVTASEDGSIPVRSWRLRNLLGTPITVESELRSTGFRLDTVRGKRAKVQTLSCLVPETAQSCRLTLLAWSDSAALTQLLLSKGVLPAPSITAQKL